MSKKLLIKNYTLTMLRQDTKINQSFPDIIRLNLWFIEKRKEICQNTEDPKEKEIS